MQTCCSSCKKQTDYIGLKKVIMTSNVFREKSICPNCMF